ncbi:MAG TPA: hypothetical protein VGX03_05990, partial [Candidatus Binatia bacterium]|nr:hypothetical protein [Candidatus Binatia bacterium]
AGVSFVLCLVSFFDLSLFFHGGNSLLHPWNSFFLGLAALCMLVVSIFAIFTAMQYLKSVVQEICKE